jgi:hypothetical protein
MSPEEFPLMTGETFHRDFRDSGAVGPLVMWPLLIGLSAYTYYATSQIGLTVLAILITLTVVREYNVYLLWRVRVEQRLEQLAAVTIAMAKVPQSLDALKEAADVFAKADGELPHDQGCPGWRDLECQCLKAGLKGRLAAIREVIEKAEGRS